DSATAGSDYVATTGSLRFPAGQTSRTITVPVIGDRLPERVESFYLWLRDPSGNARIASGQGVGHILDDEPPPVGVTHGNRKEGNSGTTSVTFTVPLSFASTEPVTVQFATANGSATAGSDYRVATGTLTFSPGETGKTITVLVYGD